MLKTEFEKVKQEKDGIEFKIEKFDKASKDLDQLLESQITDKSKKGLGYSAVPPPYPLIFNRPNKLDLSYSSLDEFKEPEFKGYGSENSKKESNVVCEKESDNSKENSNKSLVKEQVSQDKSSFVESSPNGKPQHDDKGFVDSGCSRHMTGNIAYLLNFKEFDGGYVAFRGGAYGGRISSKGTLKTDNLDFKDVYFYNELKFNLFSILQMCDKKNYFLFTDTECFILSPNFKLPNDNQILLKIPRKDNMYSFDIKNIVPKESLTCLVAKATLDESMLWHRRLVDLHGFLLTTKDETSEILKSFIKEIENLVDKNVKIIRSDNGTEFKNKVMIDFLQRNGLGKFDGKRWMKVSIYWIFSLSRFTITNDSAGVLDKNQSRLHCDANLGRYFILLFTYQGYDSSAKDVNAAGQHVNTASLDVNTGSLKLNDKKHMFPEYLLIACFPIHIEQQAMLSSYLISSGWKAMQENFSNKKDESGNVIRNNRQELVAQKFNYNDVMSASTLVDLEKAFRKGHQSEGWMIAVEVDVTSYRLIDWVFDVISLNLGQISCLQDSPFELVDYMLVDYAGATQDRKSTTRGCRFFLGNRLISWQCKKQTVVALHY
ncbi:ribonuclease H-like domain-containing protein [Tanacetum coccineum]